MQTYFRAFGALLLACCVTSLARGETGIHWQTDLAAAKQQAASTNRLVLIHFSAPWCGPCKALEAQVFNKDSVAQAIETNFVPVNLNLDLEQNKPLARQYVVSSIPYDVIITPDGQVVGNFNSPRGAQAYVGSMTEIAAKYRPQSSTMIAAAAAPPQASAVPVAYGAPAPTGNYAPAQQPRAPQYGAPQSAPQQYAAQQPAAPQQGRYSDRYADYYNGRQQPMVDPVSPPIANQAVPGPEFNPPAGVNPQATTPPGYQPPSLNAPQNTVPQNIAPPQSSPADARYGAPVYSGAPQNAMPPQGNPGYGAPAPQETTHPADPAPNGPPQASAPQSFGLDGYCPIHLMEQGEWAKGDPQFGAVHRGKTYLFLSKQCQEKFLANPDRYSPAFNGNDPVLLIDRNQTVPGRRDIGCYLGIEPNRRIVLFADEANYQTFVGNPQRYAAQAFAPRQ